MQVVKPVRKRGHQSGRPQSSPVTQSDPCCSSATPFDLPFDLATPERVLRPPLIPSLVSVSSLLLSPKQQVNPSQDGHVQDQAELPRRLRGFDQQADQHGILRLLRLSLHGININFIREPLKIHNFHLFIISNLYCGMETELRLTPSKLD